MFGIVLVLTVLSGVYSEGIGYHMAMTELGAQSITEDVIGKFLNAEIPKLNNFYEFINLHHENHVAMANVSFESGTLGEIVPVDPYLMGDLKANYTLDLNDVRIEYDVDFGLIDYPTQKGKCKIVLSRGRFDINRSQKAKDSIAEEETHFSGINDDDDDDIQINFTPDDDITKGIASELSQSPSFRKSIKSLAGHRIYKSMNENITRKLQMKDFDYSVDLKDNGIAGNMNFHSGFMHFDYLDSLNGSIDKLKPVETLVYYPIEMKDAPFTFDVKLTLKNVTKVEIKCIIHVPSARFDFNLIQKPGHKASNVEGKIKFLILDDSYRISFFPDDDLTKEMAHQLEQSASFWATIDQTLEDWNVVLQASVAEAIQQTEIKLFGSS